MLSTAAQRVYLRAWVEETRAHACMEAAVAHYACRGATHAIRRLRSIALAARARKANARRMSRRLAATVAVWRSHAQAQVAARHREESAVQSLRLLRGVQALRWWRHWSAVSTQRRAADDLAVVHWSRRRLAWGVRSWRQSVRAMVLQREWAQATAQAAHDRSVCRRYLGAWRQFTNLQLRVRVGGRVWGVAAAAAAACVTVV